MKLKGAAYLDILKAGGGIMSTVRAVRNDTESRLTNLIVHRLSDMSRGGTLARKSRADMASRPRTN